MENISRVYHKILATTQLDDKYGNKSVQNDERKGAKNHLESQNLQEELEWMNDSGGMEKMQDDHKLREIFKKMKKMQEVIKKMRLFSQMQQMQYLEEAYRNIKRIDES